MRLPRLAFVTLSLVSLFPLWNPSIRAEDAATHAQPVTVFPSTSLALPRLVRMRWGGPRGERPFDMVRAKMLTWRQESPWVPREGELVPSAGGDELAWKALDAAAAKEELPKTIRGGYLYVTLNEPRQRIGLLQASGVEAVYLNGEPIAVDVYNRDIGGAPVVLRSGTNYFLIGAADLKPRVTISPPQTDVMFVGSHLVSDLAPGAEKEFTWAGAGLRNATAAPITGLSVRVTRAGFPPLSMAVPSLAPLSAIRVAYKIPGGAASGAAPQIPVRVELIAADGSTVKQTADLQLRVAGPFDPREPFRQTFFSEIDGTTQYYALKQAQTAPGDPPPAMWLTLHGASVEASSHVRHISGKTWAHLVSPTNRGPYGFDWEDYGRKDALEALADALRLFPHDPTRVYLSGHSMGGHGTWHLGSLYPDRFAAIGPSAGWISRGTRVDRGRGGGETAIERLIGRPMQACDPEKLLANFKDRAVYVLHGGQDPTVSPSESRRMAEQLTKEHHDWIYSEQPGSHFWNSKESDSSTACVDWPEMAQTFARHVIPPAAAVRSIEFVTANPRISSRYHWLTIHAQHRHADISRAKAACWPLKRRFELTTDNVSVLHLDTTPLCGDGPVQIQIDNQNVGVAAPGKAPGIWLCRRDTEWKACEPPAAKFKGPHRYGPVKEEVDHRFVIVYGTGGTPEENNWMFAKARFDNQTYLNRANSTGLVLADKDFRPTDFADRGVILIGNADINSAWQPLLGSSSVVVKRNQIRLGDKEFVGDDLAAMFVQPRPDSDVASVVAIAASGPAGLRLTLRWSLFLPFVRYPDCLVARLTPGNAQGFRSLAAGYFGSDWSVKTGEFEFAK